LARLAHWLIAAVTDLIWCGSRLSAQSVSWPIYMRCFVGRAASWQHAKAAQTVQIATAGQNEAFSDEKSFDAREWICCLTHIFQLSV
jgi:hypothetical protein